MAESKKFLTRLKSSSGGLYEVYLEGGGEVPESLKGLYTSPSFANKAIEEHLRTRRVYKNASDSSK